MTAPDGSGGVINARDELSRAGMIWMPKRHGTTLRLEPSQNGEIRVDISRSDGMESHFPKALDLLESVEAIVEKMGLRKPRSVDSVEELAALPDESVIRDADTAVFEILEGTAWATSPWTGMGKDFGYDFDQVALPAHVLFAPSSEPAIADPAPVREPIPYDEMRRILGLLDVKLQVALDRARRTQILPYVQWGKSFTKQALTFGRATAVVPWPGGKVPEWVPVAAEKQIVESAARAAAFTGRTVEEYLEMITNLVESAPLPKPERRALPKPSHTPPMWAQNPSRTKRTRNRSTDIRTPGK